MSRIFYLIINSLSLLNHNVSKREISGVLFGNVKKYHGTFWYILVIFSKLMIAIVLLWNIVCDDKTTIVRLNLLKITKMY